MQIRPRDITKQRNERLEESQAQDREESRERAKARSRQRVRSSQKTVSRWQRSLVRIEVRRKRLEAARRRARRRKSGILPGPEKLKAEASRKSKVERRKTRRRNSGILPDRPSAGHPARPRKAETLKPEMSKDESRKTKAETT
jgi:hypothetical protein